MGRKIAKGIQCAMVAGAAVAGMAGRVDARVTLVEQVVPWDVTDLDAATMAANGWMAVKLSLVSDVPTTGIVTWDFKNPTVGFTDALHNPQNFPVGISGPIHQDWIAPTVGSTIRTPTPQAHDIDAIPTISTTAVDSFWNVFPDSYNFTDANLPSETSNKQNLATNVPQNYAGSPLADEIAFKTGSHIIPGEDFGVGSSMTWAGAIKAVEDPTSVDYSTSIHAAPVSVDIAYLVLPASGFGGNEVHIFGVVGDSLDHFTVIDEALNETPEPGTAVLLAVGAGAMLLRRRDIYRKFVPGAALHQFRHISR